MLKNSKDIGVKMLWLADRLANIRSLAGIYSEKGEAVWNLTAMFLTVWNAVRPTDKDFREFMPRRYYEKDFPSDGYVQPYGDSPLDNETVGENVYLNMIHASQQYIYMCTPYLIIDNEMMTALCLAARLLLSPKRLSGIKPYHETSPPANAIGLRKARC